MRVSVISWLRFLIFQQFNVFKLVSKNRSFQVLLHQSHQDKLYWLRGMDRFCFSSKFETLELLAGIIFITLACDRCWKARNITNIYNCRRWEQTGFCEATEKSNLLFFLNLMSLLWNTNAAVWDCIVWIE